jgi:hypothetical protein
MSRPKLPDRVLQELNEEAAEWDTLLENESPDEVAAQIKSAALFQVKRPPRQPVSVRLDPCDLSMLKRIARRKGIPYSQLIVLWLHERIEQERKVSAR